METATLTESRSIPYHKIFGPFKRETDRESPDYNNLLIGHWTTPEFAYLANNEWIWTEKVDGTNVRVHWDGVDVHFAGRTNKAQLPERLTNRLAELFPESLLEQTFGARPVTLYGEGYGGKIQKGGNYRPDEDFILFDIRIGDWWLKFDDVTDISASLMVEVVPQISVESVWEAIYRVEKGVESRVAGNGFEAEGLVGVPAVPLTARNGDRIVMKVKAVDFR